MKMTLEEAKYCIGKNGGGCRNCKFDKQEEFDCRAAAYEIAESCINYVLVGKKLSKELEAKDR
jgi:hypothetical protein